MTAAPELKSGPLCWGQRYIWLRYHQLPPSARHEAHIVLRFRLPGHLTVARVRSMLNLLIRRHEALRTTYPSDGQEPRQVVHPPTGVTLVQATTERDGTPGPAEVMDQLLTAEFDLAHEWPMRACVITTGGAPKQVVLVLNHLAFDAWSVDRLEREIKTLGAEGRPAALPPVRHQPLDLARHESSPQAQALRARAVAHWRDELAELPADPFAAVRGEAGSAYGATLTSPSLLEAGRRIAARHRVWPSLVHLTAYHLLMAAYTRSDSVVHTTFVGHRETGPYAEVMTCLFAPTLIRVDCTGNPTFGELLARTAARFDEARNHSYVPYDDIVELMSREGHRRGATMRIGAESNFISQPFRRCGMRHTNVTRNATPSTLTQAGNDLSIRINEWRDAVVVTLNVAAGIMDADTLDRFLRAYETVLLAHDDPAAGLRVTDAVPLLGASGSLTGDLLDTDRIGWLVEDHPAVAAAKVILEPDGALVAHVIADEPVTAAQLRAHVLGRTHDHPRVRCPDLFRIRHGAGPELEADGRTAEPAEAPATLPERVLAEVVAEVNDLSEVDLLSGYVVAGGRVLRVSRVLARLHERGWTGLSVSDLTGARPLRTLAAAMTPLPVA